MDAGRAWLTALQLISDVLPPYKPILFYSSLSFYPLWAFGLPYKTVASDAGHLCVFSFLCLYPAEIFTSPHGASQYVEFATTYPPFAFLFYSRLISLLLAHLFLSLLVL